MLSLLFLPLLWSSAAPLSSYINYFEPLNYWKHDLARVSRSAGSSERVKFEFNAFNRTFKLNLRPIKPFESPFAEDAIMEVGNTTTKIDRTGGIYTGTVEGDPSSSVYGDIHDGVFTGRIWMSGGKEYAIESSIRYSPSTPFHSFIYDAEDVEMKGKERRKRSSDPHDHHGDEHTCGMSDKTLAEKARKIVHDTEPSPSKNRNRSKRNAATLDSATGYYSYRSCELSIEVDHLLYRHVFATSGGFDKEKTKQAIRLMINKELRGVNEVYSITKIVDIESLSFVVSRIKIYESPSEPNYPYADELATVDKYLDDIAMQDFGEYCLGYVMTYRDFAGGTLGFAYVGAACSPHYSTATARKSPNVGIVTYINFGQPVPLSLSYLTLTHEIGHNMGSNHDENDECNRDPQGKYIMYYAATSGKDPNNIKFSPCSNRDMHKHLTEVLKKDPAEQKGHIRNCFKESGRPICGNGIVEEGEECDCGATVEECKESNDFCCMPKNMADGTADPNGCKRKPNSPCSPSQGPCCTNACDFAPTTLQCSEATECAAASMCDAQSAACPAALPNPAMVGKPCEDVTGVCEAGECKGSLCAASIAGATDCEPEGKTCMKHCKTDKGCVSTAEMPEFSKPEFDQIGRVGHPGVMMKPGSSCMNDKGRCTQFDNCKTIVASGQLSKKLGEVAKQFQSFGSLMKKKIWVLVLVVIIGAAILVVVIKFCSYATPSSNPNKPKAKSMKEIKNMMSDRVKRISKGRKKKEPKAETPKTADTKTKDEDS